MMQNHSMLPQIPKYTKTPLTTHSFTLPLHPFFPHTHQQSFLPIQALFSDINPPPQVEKSKQEKEKQMTSICISNCVNDARVPVRATYVNLYKWPESDREFVRSVSANGQKGAQRMAAPRVVDSISCRQMYLRSYTFSRKETVPERTKKCFGRVKERVVCRRKRKEGVGGGGGDDGDRKRKCMGMKKVKDVLHTIFCRLLSCSASVDVVDGRKH